MLHIRPGKPTENAYVESFHGDIVDPVHLHRHAVDGTGDLLFAVGSGIDLGGA